MLRQFSYYFLKCCSLLYYVEGPDDYGSLDQHDGRAFISSGLFLICLFHFELPFILLTAAPLDDLAVWGGYDLANALNNCFIIY